MHTNINIKLLHVICLVLFKDRSFNYKEGGGLWFFVSFFVQKNCFGQHNS